MKTLPPLAIYDDVRIELAETAFGFILRASSPTQTWASSPFPRLSDALKFARRSERAQHSIQEIQRLAK